MVIAMLMNIHDVLTNFVVLGINEIQRLLVKDDIVTFIVVKKIHTFSR